MTRLRRVPSACPLTIRFSGQTLECGLLRDSVQFCSGLVDLVVCVRRHGGGGALSL